VNGLSEFRSQNYGNFGDAGDKGKPGASGESMDEAESPTTSRIIKLSDDEQRALAQVKPGENITLKVTGNVEKDGHFHVMTVTPQIQQQEGEDVMADKVAEKVQPGILKSAATMMN
jgi:hypothetical protein